MEIKIYKLKYRMSPSEDIAKSLDLCDTGDFSFRRNGEVVGKRHPEMPEIIILWDEKAQILAPKIATEEIVNSDRTISFLKKTIEEYLAITSEE